MPGEYYTAAICRRGHLATATLELSGTRPKCAACGATILTACQKCSARIIGFSMDTLSSEPLKPADFCSACGAPFPWASRQAVVWHVQNQLDEDQSLSEGDRRALHEKLDSLLETPDGGGRVDKMQKAALDAFRRTAPVAWKVAQPVLSTLLTAELKAHLGIPPG
jgi:hypothetical protein